MSNKKDRKKSFDKSKKNSRFNRSKRSAPKKFTNKISDHFSKKDFVCKESGQFKISLGLVGVLEEIRCKVNKHIEIVKGFESIEVAEKKGKVKRNFHTMGLAADIKIRDMTPQEMFECASEIDAIRGIGLNLEESYVHIDTRKTDRVCWVEEANEEIELTLENRSKYFE